MPVIKIRIKVMEMYKKVDEAINEEIRLYGYTSLILKGRKLALLDVLMMIDGLLGDDY
jgi:hypothetical protein